MTFTDQIIAGIRSHGSGHHTGLHFVPSFNDFNSAANDDVEDMELHKDQDVVAGTPEGLPRTSNKEDDAIPAPNVDQRIDIHKTGRTLSSGRSTWMYDDVRGGRRAPSVWQFILQGQGNKAPSFTDMGPGKDGTIGAAELTKHMRVTPEQAAAMIKEADRNNDLRLSREEYHDILNEISA